VAQRRLHLHFAKLTDGEGEALDGLSPFVGVVLEGQLGEAKAGEG